MVSFSCENCGDVLTKKKLDPHRNRCRGATFTCIDCMVHFYGTEYRSHTSCITEDQKYQGALYKNKKAKTNNNNNNNNHEFNDTAATAPSVPEHIMMQQPYVEEVPDAEYEDVSDDGKSRAHLPQAPSPPPAGDGHVNVFDFLDASATPNASTLQLAAAAAAASEETQLVRYEGDGTETETYLDESGQMVDDNPHAMVQYGTGPVPTAPYETPAPRTERRKTGSELKKDKKRKRLHLDTDQIMADAPPVLHSGLTGGLNRMMAPMFPPSPDYSGGDADAADPSPGSPLKLKKKKQSKQSKHSKRSEGSLGSNLLALMGAGSSSKSKSKKRKVSSSSRKSSSQHRHSDREKAPKLIEYRPQSRGEDKDGHGDGDQQMIVYRPRADLLLSYVERGPESERGYSMRKALRHYHRERNASSDCLGKAMEEKELWRSLRMRKNDRGEIVLFGLEG